jgi:hypothetical protein
MREAPRRAGAAIVVAAAAGAVLGGAEPELVPRSEPWSASETVAASDLEPGQRVPLRAGVRLGELIVRSRWSDFRGQEIRAGRYELRYALQPRLKDHVGVDRIRDFALLVPRSAAGAAPAQAAPELWIAAARLVAGSRHPAVMALRPEGSGGTPPGAAVASDGQLVEYRTIGGLVLGFVLHGRAEAPNEF